LIYLALSIFAPTLRLIIFQVGTIERCRYTPFDHVELPGFGVDPHAHFYIRVRDCLDSIATKR